MEVVRATLKVIDLPFIYNNKPFSIPVECSQVKAVNASWQVLFVILSLHINDCRSSYFPVNHQLYKTSILKFEKRLYQWGS